ncbi:MAG: aldehyde dehydrogenase family protein, partial [Agromyces sp.]|nr:aldehyde dehydrogenase family protein [Agromyces sp.]
MTVTQASAAALAQDALASAHDAAAATLPYRHVDDLFIDGEYRPAEGAGRFEAVDPATGRAWASVPIAATADVDAAVAAARRAFPGWSGLAPSERARRLLAMADAVERRSDALATTNTLENGSPVAETSRAAANAAGILRYFASLAEYLERDDVR